MENYKNKILLKQINKDNERYKKLNSDRLKSEFRNIQAYKTKLIEVANKKPVIKRTNIFKRLFLYMKRYFLPKMIKRISRLPKVLKNVKKIKRNAKVNK